MSHGITKRREQRKAREKALRKQATADRKAAWYEARKKEEAASAESDQAVCIEFQDALEAIDKAIQALEAAEKRLEDASKAMKDAGFEDENNDAADKSDEDQEDDATDQHSSDNK